MKKKIILVLLLLVFSSENFSQPAIQWQKCLGGSYYEYAYSVINVTGGGYVIAGYSLSPNNGDVTGNHGSGDYWVVKLDDLGVMQWQKCFGGSNLEKGFSIVETSDGGFAVTGFTNSNNGDVSGNHGASDYWVIKLNSNGNLQWKKCFGGSNNDIAFSLIQTIDEGYIIAGYSTSNDGDVSGNYGSDCWIIKLDSIGSLQWQHCYGGTKGDAANCIKQTPDGGYIICGRTNSNDGDVSGNHDTTGNTSDAWILKLSDTGVIQWQKSIGGSRNDIATSIILSQNGGFAVVGNTFSNDGDMNWNHDTTGNYSDFWIVELDDIGLIQWQKCLGGSFADEAYSVIQDSEGGYLIAGWTSSNDGDVSGLHGKYDYWVVRLNNSGNLTWQKCLGGTTGEEAHSIIEATDGGYVVAGHSASNDGDVSGNHSPFLWDYWIVKLATDSLVGFQENKFSFNEINIFPNPATDILTIELPNFSAEEKYLSIYNVLGEKVLKSEMRNPKSELNISALPAGLYIAEVRTGKSVLRKKFVKE